MNVNRMLSILLERMHDLVTSVDGQVSRYVRIVHVGGTRCVTWSIDRIIQIHARITWGVVLILAIFFIFFLYVWLPLPIRSIVRLLFNVWLRRVQLWSVYPRSMSTTVSGVMKTFVAVKQNSVFWISHFWRIVVDVWLTFLHYIGYIGDFERSNKARATSRTFICPWTIRRWPKECCIAIFNPWGAPTKVRGGATGH